MAIEQIEIAATVIGLHSRVMRCDNERREAKVWHLVESLLAYCNHFDIDLDAVLDDVHASQGAVS
jgi:hypothetical protein